MGKQQLLPQSLRSATTPRAKSKLLTTRFAEDIPERAFSMASLKCPGLPDDVYGAFVRRSEERGCVSKKEESAEGRGHARVHYSNSFWGRL